MKNKNILTSIIAMIVLASVSQAQLPRAAEGNAAISFNKANFDQNLQNAVASKVIGYQYVLIKNGQIVSEKAGGVAQNGADGTLVMTTSTPTNIGSVAKFLSGTAMIGLMEKPAGQFAWDSGLSLQQKLNRPFLSIVPSVWKTGTKSGIEKITIRQLLQHRSGFDDEKPKANRTVLGFLKDNDGFLSSQYGQREYSNINFVLNGYLLPMYATSTLKDTMNTYIASNNLNEAAGDAFVRLSAGRAMHNLMKARIWDKMTPKIAPNCDGANTLAANAAYAYDSRTDPTKGWIMSIIDDQGHCGGQGGYYLSARGLAAYLAHFSSSDLIVSTAGRNAMYNESMNTNDRLVWSSATANSWLGDKFGMPNVIWSNGVTGGYRSVIVRLPQNYYLVLLTNSPDLSVSQLEAAGVSAFIAGMQHNF